jgi:hypothetical protein
MCCIQGHDGLLCRALGCTRPARQGEKPHLDLLALCCDLRQTSQRKITTGGGPSAMMMNKLLTMAGVATFFAFLIFLGHEVYMGEDFSTIENFKIRWAINILDLLIVAFGAKVTGAVMMGVSLFLGMLLNVTIWRSPDFM